METTIKTLVHIFPGSLYVWLTLGLPHVAGCRWPSMSSLLGTVTNYLSNDRVY